MGTGTRLPLHAEHQTIQPAPDAQKSDAIAALQKFPLFGERGGQRQRNGAHVAKELISGKVPVEPDAEAVKHGIAVRSADLVTNDFVDLVAGPAEFRQEEPPSAETEIDA